MTKEELEIQKKQLNIAFFASLFTFLIAAVSLYISFNLTTKATELQKQAMVLQQEIEGGKGEIEWIKLVLGIETQKQCAQLKRLGDTAHENHKDKDVSEWWERFNKSIICDEFMNKPL